VLACVGIGRAIAKVVDVKQGSQLKSLIGIEGHSRQRAEVISGLDNLLLGRSLGEGLLGSTLFGEGLLNGSLLGVLALSKSHITAQGRQQNGYNVS